MKYIVRSFVFAFFISHLSFCSIENNQQLIVYQKPVIESVSRPPLQETLALMEQSKKAWKKNVAEQCREASRIRNNTKSYKFQCDKIDVNYKKLTDIQSSVHQLQQSAHQVEKVDVDQFVAHWSLYSTVLPLAQDALCQNVYFGQERLNLLSALWNNETKRLMYANATRAIFGQLVQQQALPLDAAQAYQAVPELLPVGFSHLPELQRQVQESKDVLQESIYQSQVKAYDDQIRALQNEKRSIKRLIRTGFTAIKRINADRNNLEIEQNKLSQEFGAIAQNHQQIASQLDNHKQELSKKFQDLVWKKVALEQQKENRDYDAKAREDKRMQRIVKAERAKENRRIKELQAKQQEEQRQRDLLEQERRDRQSRVDKQTYLAQLTAQVHEREQRKLKLQEKAEEQKRAIQKELVQEEKITRLKEESMSQTRALLDEAVAVAVIEKSMIAKIPKLAPRSSFHKFQKQCMKCPEFSEQVAFMIQCFNDITTKVAQGNVQDVDIANFDELYTTIIGKHRELVAQGKGISYYMALSPVMYKKILESYEKLHQQVGQYSSRQLEESLDTIQKPLDRRKEEFALLKASCTDAIQRKDRHAMDYCLSLMKTRKLSLDLLEKELHECQTLQKKQYVFGHMLKFCGYGGILDPYRFLDKKYLQASKSFALSEKDLDMRFVVLYDHIDTILKQEEQAAVPATDSVLKISQNKSDLVHQQTAGMIRGVLRDIGLEQHASREKLIRDIYNTARIFSTDDAKDLIDLDGYIHALHKMFQTYNQGCNLAQYNTKQDLQIKLIRLFAMIFHNKRSDF